MAIVKPSRKLYKYTEKLKKKINKIESNALAFMRPSIEPYRFLSYNYKLNLFFFFLKVKSKVFFLSSNF
jgi:hypothetical protein